MDIEVFNCCKDGDFAKAVELSKKGADCSYQVGMRSSRKSLEQRWREILNAFSAEHPSRHSGLRLELLSCNDEACFHACYRMLMGGAPSCSRLQLAMKTLSRSY